MQEKLSVRKVYRNTCRYIASHPFAFAFLTVFYFVGSLLPMIMGNISFKILSLLYTYLFFYFAAGCYYKQQILLDRQVFITAGIRFATAGALFLVTLCVASVAINFAIYFFKLSFLASGTELIDNISSGVLWILGKYAVIFFLFVAFFIVPSFAFVSEITGKNRSLFVTYAKTKGSLLKIALAVLLALIILVGAMLALTQVNVMIAALARAGILTFICILYFKMYDYFYNIPNRKRAKTEVLKHDISQQGEPNVD